jgi:hypothetical protein
MATEQNFMNEIQKQILKYGGVASLLFGALWYQTNRLEFQESKTDKITEKMSARIKEIEDGLNDCNAERASLKVQVDYIQKTFMSNYERFKRK